MMKRRFFSYLVILSLFAALVPFAPATKSVSAFTQYTLYVNGTIKWVNTGINVLLGDRLDFTASGLIRVAGSDPGRSPDGDPTCGTLPTFTAPKLICWSLIGRIGNGEPFQLGSSKNYTANDTGTLYLAINDEFYGDNYGYWTVWLNHTPRSAMPPVILLPGIMGSRLITEPANLACQLLYPATTFGESWVSAQSVINLHTLVLNLNGVDPISNCYKVETYGIMDSTSIRDAYSPLITELRKHGITVESFPYDWRLSLEDSAVKLDTYINEKLQETGSSQVILVGHSMGGLLARVYVSEEQRAEKVNKVISVGSPYWGAPKMADILRSGTPPFYIKPIFQERYIAFPLISDIIRNSPGALELLPSEAYLNHIPGQTGYYINNETPLKTASETRDFFAQNAGKRGKANSPLLTDAIAFHSKYDSFQNIHPGLEYHILVGRHKSTPVQIREYPCSFLLFSDTCFEVWSAMEGDETVPFIGSAMTQENLGANIHLTVFFEGELTKGHGDLMMDPVMIRSIKNILAGLPARSQETIPSLSAFTAESIIQISVLGVASVEVRDSANNFAGLNGDGDLINNIPGATYQLFDTQTSVMLPSGQQYVVTLKQTSDIPIEIKVSDLTAPTVNDIYTPDQRALFIGVSIPESGIARLPLDLSAGLETLQLAIDENNDGTPEETLPPSSVVDVQQVLDWNNPMTTIQVDGTKSALFFYTGEVTVTLTAVDVETGIYKTQYSLDGGITWIDYLAPFSFQAEETPVFFTRSIDNAGNYEYPWRSQRLIGIPLYIPLIQR